MKLTTVLLFAAGVYRVSATGGVGLPVCIAACLPLAINPIAYAACTAGCAALGVSDDEPKRSARFLDDGTVIFEKELPQCADVCTSLSSDPLAYAACLGGCAGISNSEKK